MINVRFQQEFLIELLPWEPTTCLFYPKPLYRFEFGIGAFSKISLRKFSRIYDQGLNMSDLRWLFIYFHLNKTTYFHVHIHLFRVEKGLGELLTVQLYKHKLKTTIHDAEISISPSTDYLVPQKTLWRKIINDLRPVTIYQTN